jgi:hypothetical protein
MGATKMKAAPVFKKKAVPAFRKNAAPAAHVHATLNVGITVVTGGQNRSAEPWIVNEASR